jgi:hypothetical protein
LRYTYRRMLAVLTGLAAVSAVWGQEAARPADGAKPTVEERAANRVRQRAFQRVKARYPDLQVRAMLEFYQEFNPDLFEEMNRRCAHEPNEADDYIATLADHFMELERIRLENPDEHKRLLELEKLESKARMLGRQIQTLAARTRENKVPETLLALARARRQLADLLTKGFETEQQSQQIEVNRLEAEIRELRRLLEERAANKNLILEQRFFQLTGEEWPQDRELETTEAGER